MLVCDKKIQNSRDFAFPNRIYRLVNREKGDIGMNIIEIERLEKSFDIGDSKVKILKDINLQIQKGDFVCIMGASGSGKTTLLQLLGGLDIPSVGSIRVDGTEISTLKEKELALFRRHKIGFIFQQFNLIPVFNAEENVGCLYY